MTTENQAPEGAERTKALNAVIELLDGKNRSSDRPSDHVFRAVEAARAALAAQPQAAGDWQKPIGVTFPTAKPQPSPAEGDEDHQRALRIASEGRRFVNDRSHLGGQVYVNDLAWALGILADRAAVSHVQPKGTAPCAKPHFYYDPECGVLFFATQGEALAYAAESLKCFREDARHDGEWPAEVEDARVGIVTHAAVETGSEAEGFDYELWTGAAIQAPAPAHTQAWNHTTAELAAIYGEMASINETAAKYQNAAQRDRLRHLRAEAVSIGERRYAMAAIPSPAVRADVVDAERYRIWRDNAERMCPALQFETPEWINAFLSSAIAAKPTAQDTAP
ncbi:MAG: hypothetical protein EOP39_15750 [Rubrivivax sp.]|nr:MAG: hypothetical protein EOP39_15750 [Rubrivivax sp.]